MHHLKIWASVMSLVVGLTIQSGSAEATVQVGLGYAIVTSAAVVGVGAALNLTSFLASSVYLGMKKRSSLAWQSFSYTVAGLTLGVGVVYGIAGESAAVGGVVAVGVTTLTLSILAGTLNKPKKKPAVVFSPVLIRDMQGQITPGLGLSVLAF